MRVLNILRGNASYILKKTTLVMSGILSVLGVIELFFSFENIFSQNLNGLIGLVSTLIILWLSIGISVSIYVYFKKKTVLLTFNNGHTVNGIYDDILNLSSDKLINVVVPVNRCFDTIVDNVLISENTLHGKLFNKFYENNIFTQEGLNNEIQKKLNRLKLDIEGLQQSEKNRGNRKRYPVGTIVEVRVGNINYFMVGLTKFDSDLHASISEKEYLDMLFEIFQYITIHSQGFATYIPLIGGGHSSAYKNGQHILEFMVKFIQLNQDMINCDINIVVNETSRDIISIL